MKRWTNGLPGATKRLGAKMALRGLAASQPRMRADTHDGPEQIAPLQRPDTLMQLSRSAILEVHLVPHGRAIHFGTKRTYRDDLLLVRFRGEADMHRGSASTASVADDSSRTSTSTANGEQVVNRRQPHAVHRLDQIPNSSLSVLAVETIDCALARSSAPFFGVEKP